MQIAGGDEHAFSLLFNRHWDKLFNYLHRVIKSREAAEELCIDIFIKLWIGRELIQDIKNVDAFLYTVAHNKAMDFLKFSARNQRVQKAITFIMEETGSNAADAKIINDEMSAIITEAIEQLSPQRKLMFTMSREQGLSHDEIALRLGLTKQTVKNTISDSLSSIRDFLKKKDVNSALILWFILNA
jgi:RNA polymerase sigma-70 factor (ECF subfamily)